MTNLDLDEIKRFLKIDGDDLDVIILGYQKAAECYLQNAGVRKGYDDALYRIVITIFIAKLIENPDLLMQKKGESTNDDIGLNLNAFIIQLR